MGYDILFLFQHYVLYPENHHQKKTIEQKKRRLIAKSRVYADDSSDDDSQEVVYESPNLIKHSDRRPINANKNYGATTSLPPYSASV